MVDALKCVSTIFICISLCLSLYFYAAFILFLLSVAFYLLII